MRPIWWGTALGLVRLLGLVGSVRVDSAGELAERLRKATCVLGEMAGFFAGASFEGATVRPDGGAIRTLYGARADSRDVLRAGRYPVPVSAVLTTYSPPPKKR